MTTDTRETDAQTPATDETVELGRFRTESGAVIPELELAYATYGQYRGGNAVLVCHPLTASHRPVGGDGPFDGWWESVVGPGRPIDTTEWFVVCATVPGSPHGSSAPNRPGPDGEPWGDAFPTVTVEDWTRAQRRLADHLGIDRWAAVVGGSVGGMNALEWVRRYPDRVARAAVIAAGARLDPQCLALDAVARRAIRDDPAWHGGDYHATDGRPTHGLAQARRIGHVMYLSKSSMRQKFGRQPARAVLSEVGDGDGSQDGAGGNEGCGDGSEEGGDGNEDGAGGNEGCGDGSEEGVGDSGVGENGGDAASNDGGGEEDGVGENDDGGGVTGGIGPASLDADGPGTYRAVESYLDYNAERFAERFDPASYLRLVTAMDEYDLATAGDEQVGGGTTRPDDRVAGGIAGALAGFDGRLTLVSYTGDWHFTVEQARRVADAATSVGIETIHHRIDSAYGHDAFLVEQETLAEPLTALLADDSDAASPRVGRPDGRRYTR